MATQYHADHVGSLLRPTELLQAREAQSQGRMDMEQLREVEDKSILGALELQRQAGLEIFTDGEYRRRSFLTGPSQWLEGFAAPTESYLRQWYGPDGGMLPTKVQVVAAKLQTQGRFTAHEIAFLKEHSPGPIKVTMPSATMLGYGGFREGITDRYYDTPVDLLRDLARLINNEVKSAVSEGVQYIQIDAPNYTTRYCDEGYRQRARAEGVDLDRELDEAIAADNACFEGVSRQGVTLAFHLCRGNNRSRWQGEGGYDPIAEKLFGTLQTDRFLLEYDTERAGGFEPLRFVPRGKTVVLGLITTKEGRLEEQDTLLRRIEEASQYVPVENLAISPQCGFASGAEGNLLSWDDQRRKLELVVETSRRVWG